MVSVRLPHNFFTLTIGSFRSLSVATFLTVMSLSTMADEVDFAHDVRPILLARCVECHGPTKAEAGLRLDQRASTLRGGDSYGPAILPGKSEESPLFKFVSREDADLKMPPEGARLSQAEIKTLGRWIDAGGAWPDELAEPASGEKDHWAFHPIKQPAIPTISGDPHQESGIDAFINATLSEKGLSQRPAAERTLLIRRVYFDLSGLPPTREEMKAFLDDKRVDAYERLVDELLASPRFGERWARHWLDVVRFAESNGFEMNQARPNAWPYRDYVIRSLNEDKPYDQFLKEQLAGDQIGTDEATGFLVGGPWDQVKSPDPVLTAQQRADELHDIVSTTGSTFLGLTVGCARCHSHKFDPIPQADYYAMKAVFEGVQHGEREVPTADMKAKQAEIATLTTELQSIGPRLYKFAPMAHSKRIILLDDNSSNRVTSVTQIIPRTGTTEHQPGEGRGQRDDAGEPGRFPNIGKAYTHWDDAAGKDVFAWKPKTAGRFRVWLSWGCGSKDHAQDARYVIDQDGDLSTKNDQHEIARVDQRCFADGAGEPAETSLWSGFFDAGVHEVDVKSRIILRGGDTNAAVTADVIALEEVAADNETHPPFPALRAGVTAESNVERFEPTKAKFIRMSIKATNASEPCVDELSVYSAEDPLRNVAAASLGSKPSASGTFAGSTSHQLQHINDGKVGNAHSWISNELGRGWVMIEFAEPAVVDTVVWGRDQSPTPQFRDRIPTDYRIEVSMDGNDWQLVASSLDRLPTGYDIDRNSLTVAHSSDGNVRNELKDLVAKQHQLADRIEALSSQSMVYAGKFEKPIATHRFHRGDPMQPREEIAPGSLTSIGAKVHLPAEDLTEGRRRLNLATWMTSRDNPLPSRVIVNRLWQQHFGEGIVQTPSDFGTGGMKPSHPELLDWLAQELMNNNWHLKDIHRLIVESATYRQSSDAAPEGLAKDAGNRLLWRYPPRRLEAEPLRDTILAVSGNLDLRMGGPGFDLFESNGNYVKVYVTKRSYGPAEWRRMVYQSKPRMQLDDTFGAFDCPDAGQIAPRRNRSTTPLQALNLLNSGFILQQAKILAERLKNEAGDSAAEQVRLAFELAFQRDPSAEEQAAAGKLIQDHGLEMFTRALFNANELLTVY